MGQQLRVRAKRKRRKAYLERRKTKEKNSAREAPRPQAGKVGAAGGG